MAGRQRSSHSQIARLIQHAAPTSRRSSTSLPSWWFGARRLPLLVRPASAVNMSPCGNVCQSDRVRMMPEMHTNRSRPSVPALRSVGPCGAARHGECCGNARDAGQHLQHAAGRRTSSSESPAACCPLPSPSTRPTRSVAASSASLSSSVSVCLSGASAAQNTWLSRALLKTAMPLMRAQLGTSAASQHGAIALPTLPHVLAGHRAGALPALPDLLTPVGCGGDGGQGASQLCHPLRHGVDRRQALIGCGQLAAQGVHVADAPCTQMQRKHDVLSAGPSANSTCSSTEDVYSLAAAPSLQADEPSSRSPFALGLAPSGLLAASHPCR